MITNALRGKKLPIYGDGLYARDWLHVEDHCRALDLVLRQGKAGQVYNIGGDNEWENLKTAKLVLKYLGKPEALIAHVTDRLGHDRRYALDFSKLTRELGWRPKIKFEDGLLRTVDWYVQNQKWLERIRSIVGASKISID